MYIQSIDKHCIYSVYTVDRHTVFVQCIYSGESRDQAERGSRRFGAAGGDHQHSMLTGVNHVSADLGDVLHAR